MHIEETSLEWSLKHHKRFYSSDFYPQQFEFKAIAHNWENVKEKILKIDLEDYTPKSPFYCLAPKSNDTFRVAHLLDPIDSLIYTALVYEVSEHIEDYRIPESEGIACSYRIKPDLNGSFFDKEDSGWRNYISKTEELSNEFEEGFIILTDITDFYNQIYTHRVENIIAEALPNEEAKKASIIEDFLMSLNNKTSQGIPVGPAASIILAEAIMADIDKKIFSYTRSFTRWVDDLRIFAKTREKAENIVHELTKYLYTNHRLVLSSEKTKILSTKSFKENIFIDEEKEEQKAKAAEEEKIIDELIEEQTAGLSPYTFFVEDEVDMDEIYEKVKKEHGFQIISNAYSNLLEKAIEGEKIDVAISRHVLRRCAHYRIRSVLPILLDNFEKFRAVIREFVLYLDKVIDEKVVERNSKKFKAIFDSYLMDFNFINIWLSHLLENEAFEVLELDEIYKKIDKTRNKALIAKRKNDKTWVKSKKDGLDVLGPLDKRAILFSSSILSKDEMDHWISVVSARGDLIDKSIASFLKSKK